MKFDKETIIVIIIGAAILFGWDPLCRYMGWFQVPVPVQKSTVKTAAPAAPGNAVSPVAASAQSAPAKNAAALKLSRAVKPAPFRQDIAVSNRDLRLWISPMSGSVSCFELSGYRNADRKSEVRFVQSAPGTFSFCPPNTTPFILTQTDPQAAAGQLSLKRIFSSVDGALRFAVIQKWQLKEKGFTVEYSCQVQNLSSAALPFAGSRIAGPVLLPWAKVSGDKVRIPSHRLDLMTAAGKFEDISGDAKAKTFAGFDGERVKWAGAGNKYFCLLLEGAEPYMLQTTRKYVSDGKNSVPQIGVDAVLNWQQPFAANEMREVKFRLYAGPKIISGLEAFNPSTGRVMHLAWGPLDYLARLLLWVLVKINSTGIPYGWSIIILTLIVRILFYPMTAKANASMRKMSVVQPKMKEIKEKYKDNPQLMNAKMMELYRTEGVNPFGGCLPLLLQIPVFFALYATLDGAVELRQIPFLWCADLAGPDTVCHIPLIWYELPVNPLVLIMTGLMVLQQHMTPMAGDPMQRKMMMFMPLIMLLFFYDLPSGLTLYWSVSNFFSIIQLLLQKRSGQLAGTPQNPVPVKK